MDDPCRLVAGGHRSSAVGFCFAEWPWWRYLMTQAGVVTHYLRLAVLRPAVLDYEWPAAASLAALLWPGLLMRPPRRLSGGRCGARPRIRRGVLFPDPRADLERRPDRDRGGGGTPDVPAGGGVVALVGARGLFEIGRPHGRTRLVEIGDASWPVRA